MKRTRRGPATHPHVLELARESRVNARIHPALHACTRDEGPEAHPHVLELARQPRVGVEQVHVVAPQRGGVALPPQLLLAQAAGQGRLRGGPCACGGGGGGREEEGAGGSEQRGAGIVWRNGGGAGGSKKRRPKKRSGGARQTRGTRGEAHKKGPPVLTNSPCCTQATRAAGSSPSWRACCRRGPRRARRPVRPRGRP